MKIQDEAMQEDREPVMAISISGFDAFVVSSSMFEMLTHAADLRMERNPCGICEFKR